MADGPNDVAGNPQPFFYEAIQRIYLTLRAGGSRKDAYVRAGVPPSTFFTWVKNGREGIEPYKDFSDQMDQIQTDFKLGLVGLIAKSAAGDPRRNQRPQWVAAAWLLERKFGKEFAKLDEEKVVTELLKKVSAVETRIAQILVKEVPEDKKKQVTEEISRVFKEINT